MVYQVESAIRNALFPEKLSFKQSQEADDPQESKTAKKYKPFLPVMVKPKEEAEESEEKNFSVKFNGIIGSVGYVSYDQKKDGKKYTSQLAMEK